MSYERVRPDEVYRRGRSAGPSGSRSARRRPSTPTPFRRLSRTHALMTIGDAAMYGALAGSVLFSLSPGEQRPRVLLYLLVSVAPFAVVAPAIGPTVDRIPGGRRMVMQITSITRALLYVVMAFHVDDVLLYPLVFGALVMQKTYAVSKSALVPSVVRSDVELVEANSKLSLISGVVGAIAIGPLAGLGKLSATTTLFVGAVVFVVATLAARRLPRDVIAAAPAQPAEKVELRSVGIILGAGAMGLIRATVGFLTFHLFFWLNKEYGLAQFGVAAGASTLGSLLGNVSAPRLRKFAREELMLTASLAVIAVSGVMAAATGGFVPAVMLALVVGVSSAVGRLAFDSIVQRDAPDANQGRAFAMFETRFQLAWVLAGVPPALFTLPGQIGFLVVGVFGAFAAATYLIGFRAVRAGKPVPPTLTERARRGIAAKRRGTPARGGTRPLPPPEPPRGP